MTDLTETLLTRIKDHRLPGLDLGDDFIYPNYQGLSILNTPSTICTVLGAEPLPSPTLAPEIMQAIGGSTKKVILILMDALALHRLQAWMQADESLVWNRLAEQGLLAPLTSITPSTTSAAITTYWTGAPPAQHGIGGYEQWLREYGIIANMIEHKPITYRGRGGEMSIAGFDPQSFLPVSPIGPHLAGQGISIHSFQHFSIIHSGLSKMFMDRADLHPFSTAADLMISLRDFIEAHKSEKLYTWVYWSHVDGLSHFHGPDSERPRQEFTLFSQAFERLFLDQLSPQARKDTLVILTADHGQITTNNLDRHYDLGNHPGLMRRLHFQPTGENRLPYLYVKPGQIEAVREYIERTWPGQFTLLESAYALENGLFGPGVPYEAFADRIGDLTVLAKGNAYWWWGNKENFLIGRHGGLHAEEMLVPFLAAKLG
ncbi:MAG: alkaline phosphatase family protein [Anaerolineae bacterium]|nr:alkaline phosphatase family protein [Anaerolineae bacterium]